MNKKWILITIMTVFVLSIIQTTNATCVYEDFDKYNNEMITVKKPSHDFNLDFQADIQFKVKKGKVKVLVKSFKDCKACDKVFTKIKTYNVKVGKGANYESGDVGRAKRLVKKNGKIGVLINDGKTYKKAVLIVVYAYKNKVFVKKSISTKGNGKVNDYKRVPRSAEVLDVAIFAILR